MKKFGFTLAEVLITLTIIGVIAALTIPTLIGKYEKHQTVVALKKAYSELNNAVKMSVSDNGDVSTWSWTGDEAWVNKYFIPYFKIVETTTLHEAKKRVGGNYYQISGTPETWLSTLSEAWPTKVITLTSGAQIWIPYHVETITHEILIDINGYKKPNTLGKDVFHLHLWRNSGKVLFDTYCRGNTEPVTRSIEELKQNSCDNSGCNKNSQGLWCGALIQASGWEITDDYPW